MTKNTITESVVSSDTDSHAARIKAGRPKNLKKRQQILSAASHLFLQQGFSASSMDNVAQSAGVSKQTVYSHFANKEALFTAVIQHKVEQYRLDGETAGCRQLALDVRLKNIGQRFVRLLQDPEASAMYRVVIGEFKTAPQVAEIFYRAGPQHGFDMFCEVLEQSEQPPLASSDKHRLAVEFFNLLKGECHMRNLLGLVTELTPEQEEVLINNAVQYVISRLSHTNHVK
jgi:TetR/AcrR family transcriptional repressor of mexJK operon